MVVVESPGMVLKSEYGSRVHPEVMLSGRCSSMPDSDSWVKGYLGSRLVSAEERYPIRESNGFMGGGPVQTSSFVMFSRSGGGAWVVGVRAISCCN
jgi:hypothetical protein